MVPNHSIFWKFSITFFFSWFLVDSTIVKEQTFHYFYSLKFVKVYSRMWSWWMFPVRLRRMHILWGFFFHFVFCGFFCCCCCLFLCCPACRILVSPLGIHPGPPAVVAQSPNHWTAWEQPNIFAVFFWLALTPQWNACHMKRILRFPPPDALRLTQTALHMYTSGEKLSPARPGFRRSGKALWRT